MNVNYECSIPGRQTGQGNLRLDAVEWCRAQFGQDSIPDHNDGVWSWSYPRYFHFRNEKDYMLFLLRWS